MVMPVCCERHDQARGTDGSLADRNSFLRQDMACLIDSLIVRSRMTQLDSVEYINGAPLACARFARCPRFDRIGRFETCWSRSGVIGGRFPVPESHLSKVRKS